MAKDSGPMFVKVEKYKEIMDVVEVINKKVIDIKQLLTETEELKAKEEEEIMSWEKNMDEITRKIESLKEELSQDEA